MIEAGAPASRKSTRPWHAMRQISDRTPLRTKLITAVLVLVAIAVAAISVATTYMVRAYLIDQHDSELLAQVSAVNYSQHLPQDVNLGYASPTRSDIVVGLEQPGSQLKPPLQDPAVRRRALSLEEQVQVADRQPERRGHRGRR